MDHLAKQMTKPEGDADRKSDWRSRQKNQRGDRKKV